MSCTVLVPCWDVEGGEDAFGFGGQGVGGGEVVAVEVDGDVLEGFEGADDALDADPGSVLEVSGYGQGGHHHGQVKPRWPHAGSGRRDGLSGHACSSEKTDRACHSS